MKIAIIGCGNMGSGIARRFSNDNELFLYDIDEQGMIELAYELQASPCSSGAEAAKAADVIILAVRPQDLQSVAMDIRPELRPRHLVVSCLAGTPMSVLAYYLGDVPILRITLNLASAYGEGVIGCAENPALTFETKKSIEKLFSVLGTVTWLHEDKIDGLTAIVGSGPAFAYVGIEAMVDAAISMGFSPAEGQEYVFKMLMGALTMLRETAKHPADLKWQVISPEGMTMAGLTRMEEDGIRAGIIHAFMAAYNRARQLSKEMIELQEQQQKSGY